MLLLLVENYTQYPAPTRWNTLVRGNFWLALRGYLQSNPKTDAPHFKFLPATSHRFSAFWLRSKCSICSYQLNIWYGGHVSPSILNWFLQGDEVQELAPASSRVGLVLQYRQDRLTPHFQTIFSADGMCPICLALMYCLERFTPSFQIRSLLLAV